MLAEVRGHDMRHGRKPTPPRVPKNNDYGWCVLAGFVLLVIGAWMLLITVIASTTIHVLPGSAEPQETQESHAEQRYAAGCGNWRTAAATPAASNEVRVDREVLEADKLDITRCQ